MSSRSATDRLLALRADGSSAIGLGHVARATALAHAWQDAGGRALLAARDLPTEVEQRLAADGIEVVRIAADGTGERELAALRPAWIAIDGYRISPDEQEALATLGAPILVTDDAARTATSVASLVVDTSPVAEAAQYDRATQAQLLLGPSFVSLRREFLGWRSWQRPVPAVGKAVQRVLVTMGGSDATAATPTAVGAALAATDGEVVAVAGPAAALDTAPVPRVRWEVAPPDMAALMADADLAVAAAGTTCWELAFCMVPMVLVALTPDQEPNREALAAAGAAVAVAELEDLAAAVADLAADAPRRARAAAAGRSLVDGLGGARVVQCMLEMG